MAYPSAQQLQLPIEPYAASGYRFKQRLRRRIILWATHLGDDIVAKPGTPVAAISEGEVVWAETRPGTAAKRNWGGIIVIGHAHRTTGTSFFSLYGHLRDLTVTVGQTVSAGQVLGAVAEGSTPENGWWATPHLHFAVYTGPWRNTILPGYKRPEQLRTKIAWWHDPLPFIKSYNQ